MSEPSKQGDDGIKKSTQRWQSDVIVDLIKQYEFPVHRAQSRRELSRPA